MPGFHVEANESVAVRLLLPGMPLLDACTAYGIVEIMIIYNYPNKTLLYQIIPLTT